MVKMNTNGSDKVVLLTSRTDSVAHDPVGQKIYYQDNSTTNNPINVISDTPPTTPTTILTQGTYDSYIYELAIDEVNRKLYLADNYGDDQKIFRCDLDGENLELVADVSGSDKLMTIALDVANEQIYYGTWDGVIGRVDYDGTNDTVLLQDGNGPVFTRSVIVPEPGTLSLLAVGVLAVIGRKKR